jgi:hypothetical protein
MDDPRGIELHDARLKSFRRDGDDVVTSAVFRQDDSGAAYSELTSYCNGGKMEASPLTAKTVPFTSCPSASRYGIITTTE